MRFFSGWHFFRLIVPSHRATVPTARMVFLSSPWGNAYALTNDKKQWKKRNNWIITYIFILMS